ncbi:hypothetical protein Ddye_000896 [Dipteronia dyeriana]|uniref:Uncharacterized protein n=1 Tax=Dipteronia dyeriana TaxID=168575 RepID=A0AAE0CSZ3_9ROSI|nr:hypothetical protein Ddye_000896 [Dipteronia dyeriana]
MSYLLPHLHSGWAVDQAILAEEERLVVIRFGHGWDKTCIQVMLDFVALCLFVNLALVGGKFSVLILQANLDMSIVGMMMLMNCFESEYN